MATKKVRTEEQKRADTDKRIQKKFHITLARREEMKQEQNHRCKICGGALDAHGHPAIDHYHFHVKIFPLSEYALPLKWGATAYDECGNIVQTVNAKTQVAARTQLKTIIMPWSIRGILCSNCNYGLGCIERFFDAAHHPDNLIPVMNYLWARITK